MEAMQNQAMQPDQTAQQGQPAQQGQQADPKQQENYERVVLAGMQILYSDETHQSIVQQLRSGADDPAKALADTTVLIVSQLDEKAGGKIPRDVIMHAALEILSLVGELADKSGAFPIDEQMMKAAAGQMTEVLTQKYGNEQPGQQQPAVQPQSAMQPQGGIINQAMGATA